MKYNPPYGTDPNGDSPYINGDPSIGRQGSIIPAEAVEYPQREIVALIEGGKLAADNADLSQLLFSVRSQRMNYALAVASGSANTVAVEFDPPIADTMTPGMPLRIKAIANNTGAALLKTDGISSPLRHADGSELAADEIKSGVIFGAVWNDGGYWEFDSYLGGAGGGGAETNTFIDIPFIADTGVENALVGTFVPAITSLTPGKTVEVKLANNITGPSTLKVNALAPVPIVRGNGAPLQNGDAVAGQIMLLIYSSTAGAFQFNGVIPQALSNLGPVGTIMLTIANAVIPGTLKLNGALINRADHPLLWLFANASGRIVTDSEWSNVTNRYWTAFSLGNGTTTFRLPDFRGEFMRFWDDARGIDAARVLARQQDGQVGAFGATGTLTLENLIFTSKAGLLQFSPPFVIIGGGAGAGIGTGTEVMLSTYNNVDGLIGTMTISANTGMETRVRNAAVMPCIVDG